MKAAFTDYGIIENSGQWSGIPSDEARREMTDYAEEKGFGKAAITYRIKDWGVSRQRYWGTPIPVIHCPTVRRRTGSRRSTAGHAAANVEITGKGRSPLEKCPSS